MNTLTTLFAVALALRLATELWLSQRQIHSVVAHRDQVPKDFAARIGLANHKKAADYSLAMERVGQVQALYATGLLLGWTLGGGLDLLSDWWQQRLGETTVAGVALLLTWAVFGALLDLPVGAYRQFVIERRFGFNRMSVRTFVIDLLKSGALLLVLGGPIAAAFLWVMGATGSAWWLYAWTLWMAFNLLLLWLYPAWIAPLFNKFRPLQDSILDERIQTLANKTGFRAGAVQVMDGSRRSAHSNAYFTGFGRNKRIVLFDTLLQSLSHEEIEAVLAHELGHFKLRHVIKRIALSAVLSLAGLALLGWLESRAWFYVGLGVSHVSQAVALALFLLVIPVFTFPLHPIFALGSRKHEFAADEFAVRHSSADDLISALVKLCDENAGTLTPDPLYSSFYDSHPPLALRVGRLRAMSST